MVRFLYQRIIFITLVALFITFGVHLGMRMVNNSELQEPNFELVTHSKIAWQETRTYLSNALKGDFGEYAASWGEGEVKDLLRGTYINSMGLLLTSLVISAGLGLYIGGVIGLTKRQFLILPLLTITMIGISAPSFFSGVLLQTAELKYQAFFGQTLFKVAGFGWEYKYMVLPILVLSARPLAYITRATFIAIDQINQEDFIRTAHSKGLLNRIVIYVHMLKNVAVPVLTSVGVSLRFSLSTLPVVEFLFVWPGLGMRLVQGINDRSTAIVVTLALALGLTLQIVNLLLDLSYRIIDPRLRELA